MFVDAVERETRDAAGRETPVLRNFSEGGRDKGLWARQSTEWCFGFRVSGFERQATNHEPRTTVIHIQDAHCNYDAQKKIAEIIKYLNEQYGITSVNLEGGKGKYDLTPFTKIEDRDSRLRIADYFLQEGLINGAEYFAVNDPGKVNLWGIEDETLYFKNLDVYKNSLSNRAAINSIFGNISRTLDLLRKDIYGKELFELDEKARAYESEKISLQDYVVCLSRVAEKMNIDLGDFSNVSILRQSISQENRIDFKKANIERDQLIDRLHKILSDVEIEELVIKTVEFKDEKINGTDFYGYLTLKAAAVNISIKDYPELEKYLKYINEYKSLDNTAAMKEMGVIEKALKDALCVNSDQKELCRLINDLKLMKNLFDITVTRDDYECYKEKRGDFKAEKYFVFINTKAPLSGIKVDKLDEIYKLDGYLDEFAKFYEYSFARDEAFLKNMKFTARELRGTRDEGRGTKGETADYRLQTIDNRPGDDGRKTMDERRKTIDEGRETRDEFRTPNPEPRATSHVSRVTSHKPQVTILVTGGFHTDNLCELFRKNNIAYISIVPKFKNPEDYKAPYFNVLAGNKGALMQMITSNVSALAIASMLSEMQVSQQEKSHFEYAIDVLYAMQRENGVITLPLEAGGTVTYSKTPSENSKTATIGGYRVYVTRDEGRETRDDRREMQDEPHGPRDLSDFDSIKPLGEETKFSNHFLGMIGNKKYFIKMTNYAEINHLIDREFKILRILNPDGKNVYFPFAYNFGGDKAGRRYIIMDFIEGR
ncbi:MAG: hypothetical protein PHW46_00575, partial [Candidatus Omnitrophica bacterium]|nr:hypothetical protein [Candidatus Omnitrophota bacterium]